VCVFGNACAGNGTRCARAQRAGCSKHSAKHQCFKQDQPCSTTGAGAAVMTRTLSTSGTLVRVLAPHIPVCACFAPVCVYLAPVCTFVGLFVLALPRACESSCCSSAGPLCVGALHLISCVVPVPARVFCLAFGRHYGEFPSPIHSRSS